MDEREDRIRARAFELWQQEGSLDGRSLSHWLQAEKEVEDEKRLQPPDEGPNPDGYIRYRSD